MIKTVGLVGARGYTGRELIRLIGARKDLELSFASSREYEGRAIGDIAAGAPDGMAFVALGPDAVARSGVDAVILALPNGAAAPFVEAIDRQAPGTVIVDLSADYRFDEHWTYGLPEIYGRDAVAAAQRISNPGCYATAGQLAIAPMRDRLSADAHVFGVSGYSGAGTKPSRKNDLEALKNNLMPYALSGHIHEREMSRHLGASVRFTPHVAEFFQGIVATVHLEFSEPVEREQLIDRYRAAYAGEALIETLDEIPEVTDIAGRNGAVLGGFALDESGRKAVIVSALDNLLKGAAVQALQNLTLALGLPEFGRG